MLNIINQIFCFCLHFFFLFLLSPIVLQKITIPCSKDRDEARIFTFGVTNVARDNPHGSFDCVQQLSTG